MEDEAETLPNAATAGCANKDSHAYPHKWHGNDVKWVLLGHGSPHRKVWDTGPTALCAECRLIKHGSWKWIP